jgi:ABC-type dipeptide/oligopeptide/nickel transport system permease subunit
VSPLDRAIARLWLSLPFVRKSRRMGVSTTRMIVLYVLVNWWIIAVIEAVLNMLTTGRIDR